MWSVVASKLTEHVQGPGARSAVNSSSGQRHAPPISVMQSWMAEPANPEKARRLLEALDEDMALQLCEVSCFSLLEDSLGVEERR